MAYETGHPANSNFSMVPFPVISPEIFHEHEKGSDWAGDGGIGLTEKKDISKFIDAIIYEVYESFNELYGEDSEATRYFRTFGKCLVVQETNVIQMKAAGESGGYRNCSGDYGGLNVKHRPFLDRIHILVDSEEGIYLANNLHDNYHYQVKMVNLRLFLGDVIRQKIGVYVVGSTCGRLGRLGLYWLQPPTKGAPDCILYTSRTPFVASLGWERSQEDGDFIANPNSIAASFVCAIGKGVREFNGVTDKLMAAEVYDHLTNRKSLEDNGALMRNQSKVLTHGFSCMNWTNKERSELHNISSPQLTSSLSREVGLDGDENMAESAGKIMLGLTNVIDSVCGLFGLDRYFNDEQRNRSFANTIVENNRVEAMASSLVNNNQKTCDGFACHVDRYNGRAPGYTMNVTYFKYMRNSRVTSPDDEDYFERLHCGGYGRNPLDSTCKRAGNITRLLDDLEEYLDEVPHYCKSYDPVVVLAKIEGDVTCEFDDSIVGRSIHVNKRVFYSFGVYMINDWRKRRRLLGVPVSWPELLEAVLTSVRWTPCLATWSHVFKQVTSDAGVQVKIPQGVRLCDELTQAMNDNRQLPLCKSYESPLPLSTLYMFKSIELLGGVGIGKFRRFQPFANGKISAIKEWQSSRYNLPKIVNGLNRETARRRLDFERENKIDDDDSFIEYAKAIEGITSGCIGKLSAPMDKGGVIGLGSLTAHHFIGILSSGAWIDEAHVLNTRFSIGNGTSDFLLINYDIDIVRHPDIIDTIAESTVMEPFGLDSKPVAENSTCKMGGVWRIDNSDSRFMEPVCIKPDSFLCQIKNGVPVVLTKDGQVHQIRSGVHSRIENSNYDIDWDWSVTLEPPVKYAPSRAEDVFLQDIFSCKDDRVKRAKLQTRKKAQRKKRRQCQISTYEPPNRKWGHLPKSKYTKESFRRRRAKEFLSQVLHQRMWVLQDIDYGSSQELLDRLQRQFCNDTNACLQALWKEVDNMVNLLQDPEDINETRKVRETTNKIFNKLMRNQERSGKSGDCQRSTRTSGDQTSLIGDDSLTDPSYTNGDYFNNFFLTVGKWFVPTFYAIRHFMERDVICINITDELANALGVKPEYIIKHLKRFTMEEYDCHYYTYSLEAEDGSIYLSTDETFAMDRKNKKRTAWTIGMHHTTFGKMYETSTHAKMALLFNILQRKSFSIEDRFLQEADYIQITPNERWAMDINDGPNAQLKMHPIVCVLRNGSDILCLDIDYLRILDFQKERTFVETVYGNVSADNVTTKTIMKRDKCTHHFDPKTKAWMSLPVEKIVYYQRKNFFIDADKSNRAIVTYCGDAKFYNRLHLPTGVVKMELGVDAPAKWVKVTCKCDRGKRTVYYWISPDKKFRLRSKPEVNFFLLLLREMGGDENEVIRVWRERNRDRMDMVKSFRN